MIRCLAVDDEPLARRLLTSFVGRVPFLALAGTCASAFEALAILQREAVDLIFLDIQMPDLTGVEFVRSLRPGALVVFTTAFEQYAVEGFQLNAVDYLVKPIAFERFLHAAQRAQERLSPPAAAPPAPALIPPDEYIFLKVDYHMQRVNLRDIRYLEGLKDYVKVHINAPRTLLTLNSLRAFEERLPKPDFLRVHRSYIVSFNQINSVRANRIYLGDTILPIGDSYYEAFQQVLATRNML